MGVTHSLVVEPQELDEYRAAVKELAILAKVIPLDMSYKDRYETCDSLGLTKGTGPGPARNFIWDHSIAAGAAWHWVIDDNIREFYRLNKNLKIPCRLPNIWRAMEDFALRYTNVAMAGPNYQCFAKNKDKLPPFVINTRIYSCNLIRNDVPFRWRGRYNEDTILSLDMLKAGWTTIQFNAFLAQKFDTQELPGGNTDEFYLVEGKRVPGKKYAVGGTDAKSAMLARVHRDCARIVWKFNRVHHVVDFRRFKKQKLVRKPELKIAKGANEYGMRLHEKRKEAVRSHA